MHQTVRLRSGQSRQVRDPHITISTDGNILAPDDAAFVLSLVERLLAYERESIERAREHQRAAREGESDA